MTTYDIKEEKEERSGRKIRGFIPAPRYALVTSGCRTGRDSSSAGAMFCLGQ
jgi:hypothetical protein